MGLAVIDLKLEIHGVERVLNGLKVVQRAFTEVPDRIVRARLERAVERIRTYPPELPEQKYIRTGVFGDTTTLEHPAPRTYNITLAATEAARAHRPYSRYVAADVKGKGQYWLHRGRWRNAFYTVTANLREALRDVDRELRNIIRAQPGLQERDFPGGINTSGLEREK